MNLCKATASVGSAYAGLCKRGRPGRFRCRDHSVKSIAFNAAGTHLCWFLETASCSTSHDSSCCAHQMLITECVTSQPEACYPRLQKLIDIGSWTTSENLFTQWQDLFSRNSVHESSRTGSFLSLLTLYRVRTHAACLITHGRIGECVVASKDGKFVFENCQI